MTKETETEVSNLKSIVVNWRESHRKYMEETYDGLSAETWMFLCDEFMEEIQNYLCPYVRRLWDTGHLTQGELNELLINVYANVKTLREEIETIARTRNPSLWRRMCSWFYERGKDG